MVKNYFIGVMGTIFWEKSQRRRTTFYGFGRRSVQGVKNSAWRARNEKFGVECAGNSAYIFVNLRTVGVRMQVLYRLDGLTE